MMQVQDLNIEADILPLFDFTNNDYAFAELTKIFRELPATLAAAQDRQAVLQGFLSNWSVLENFSYPRLYFNEVYALFQTISTGEFVAEASALKGQLRLRLSETERNQKRSQYIQVVLLLDNIYRRYLGRLDTATFPATFKQPLEQALQFLGQLNLAGFASQINEDKFSVAQIIAFNQNLGRLSPATVQAFWQFFFSFEAYYSVARAIRQHNFSFPVLGEMQFCIEDLYHPLLSDPVKNSITISGEENTVLLTGPNMSGKSTLLKAVGLCVYLAHLGLAVPAAACRLPFYDTIVVAISVNDNLRNGYSHFMSEIINLKTVLQEATAGKKCFAIFDELFKGTNIDDAQEITLTTLNGLGKFSHSLFFISTHLLHLESQLAPSTAIGKYCIQARLQAGTPVFTYTLQKGWSDLKIGKILFQKEGLGDLLKIN